MSCISDFNDADRWMVETALKAQCGKRITVELADSEFRLDPASGSDTLYPTFYWEKNNVEFVIIKLGESLYRSQFCYSPTEHYGTGHDFDDLIECVSTTLKLQAEHARDLEGVTAVETGADLVCQ